MKAVVLINYICNWINWSQELPFAKRTVLNVALDRWIAWNHQRHSYSNAWWSWEGNVQTKAHDWDHSLQRKRINVCWEKARADGTWIGVQECLEISGEKQDTSIG